MDFYLQGLAVALPAALRKTLLQLGNRGQRGVALALAIFRISLPVECRIRLRAVHLGQVAEFLCSRLVLVFLERFAAFFVTLLHPFEPFLLPVLLLLFPLARLVAFLLLSLAGFLLAVLLAFLIRKPVRFLRWRQKEIRCTRERPCRQCRRRQQTGCQSGDHALAHSVYDAHTLFLSFAFESVCAGWDFLPVSAVCNSCRTTRTFNKIPCSSMRFWIDSNCAGVTSSGLLATSSSTRSSSSRVLAIAWSPPSSAVCRNKRFSATRFSARRCSAAMLISFWPLAGCALESSTSTISDLPRCSPTATTSTRSRTLPAPRPAFSLPVSLLTLILPVRNAAIMSTASAPATASRCGRT